MSLLEPRSLTVKEQGEMLALRMKFALWLVQSFQGKIPIDSLESFCAHVREVIDINSAYLYGVSFPGLLPPKPICGITGSGCYESYCQSVHALRELVVRTVPSEPEARALFLKEVLTAIEQAKEAEERLNNALTRLRIH